MRGGGGLPPLAGTRSRQTLTWSSARPGTGRASPLGHALSKSCLGQAPGPTPLFSWDPGHAPPRLSQSLASSPPSHPHTPILPVLLTQVPDSPWFSRLLSQCPTYPWAPHVCTFLHTGDPSGQPLALTYQSGQNPEHCPPQMPRGLGQQELSLSAGGDANGAATLEDSLVVFTKLNILLPYAPAVVLLGVHPRELKTHIHTDTYRQVFFHSCQNLEATNVPFSRWINKLWSI